jgi:hypothetical protein
VLGSSCVDYGSKSIHPKSSSLNSTDRLCTIHVEEGLFISFIFQFFGLGSAHGAPIFPRANPNRALADLTSDLLRVTFDVNYFGPVGSGWVLLLPNPHLGSRGRNLQSIGCGLGGKSRVG